VKLGLVTYNLAKDWDLETLIARCAETGFEGVELRTSHAHGVEVGLAKDRRAEVRCRFAASPVTLVGLGSAFEYDALDPEEVRRQIAGTKEYILLARDLGAPGIKVRPNRVHDEEGVPREKTFEQIGLALRECAAFGRDHGVEVRLEVHGRVTCEPVHIRRILDHAAHENLYVCWNSNMQDLVDGSIDGSFALLAERIRLVHVNELWTDYPWRHLFTLLGGQGYAGFCLAEIPESPEPIRLMEYYRALWLALAGEGAR
jgi:sugar phosphate isomerase/epimerase